MRALAVLLVALAGLLTCLVSATASAQGSGAASNDNDGGGGLSSDPDDPGILLQEIQRRGLERESLIPFSPLGPLRDRTDQAKQRLYEAIGLKLGLAFNSLGQTLSKALPREARSGMATDMDFVGKWELVHRGTPTRGGVLFGIEGRWDYATVGPTELGTFSLGSAIGTANTYAAYTPEAFLVRNLYWQQGSREAGWAYRIGKITPDAILDTSANLSPTTTFLSTAGTGPFANALPDSGLGIVGAWFITDRITFGGLVSDANADRFNFGDIGAGDFYKAVELQAKFFPKNSKAGASKITLWHNDGTKDGLPINGSSGREGWGIFVKHEHQLSSDGKAVGILKWGRGFNNSAFYRQLAGAYFLLYDPPAPIRVQNDLFGVGFSWGKASQIGARDEYSVEAFYRFPFFPLVDTTLHYQSVINPAFTTAIDHASAFSLRLRTTF